ncbi:MAG: ribbon-helix-helix protein, CopG family [Ruminococcaceae bacterium]|nr:ribbon-helix-helix protein, CopG family [Oscillospiraceae bacterium]
MATAKKVELELPENLLNEVDSVAERDNISRNELLEHAMRFYLEEREKRNLRSDMIKGYQEMAELNLKIAEEFFCAENDLLDYESAE